MEIRLASWIIGGGIGGVFAGKAASTYWGTVGMGALGGGVSGGAEGAINALIHGQNVTDAILKGAIYGSVSGALGGHFTYRYNVINKAIIARDNAVREMSARGEFHHAVVAVADFKTGRIITAHNGKVPDEIVDIMMRKAAKIGGIRTTGVHGKNIVGRCAEFRGANEMIKENGTAFSDLYITDAFTTVKPRIKERCLNCLSIFGPVIRY